MNTVEFCKTSTGARNELAPEHFDNARKTIVFFDFIEKELKKKKLKIFLTSGYRSSAVNSLVGGSKTSAHLTGLAFDCVFVAGKTAHSTGTYREILLSILDSKDFKIWCDVTEIWLDQFIIGYNQRSFGQKTHAPNVIEEAIVFRNFHFGLSTKKKNARNDRLQMIYKKNGVETTKIGQ